jgi:glycine dehydrogenase subunit 1
VLVAAGLHPEYRATIATYTRSLGVKLVDVPFEPASGRLDESALVAAGAVPAAALVVQSPNFFGVIEDLAALAPRARSFDGLLVAVHTEPFSLGLLKSPGELGADIAAGEWQAFGNPPLFGGPNLGVLAAREGFLRQMPGRIVGRTTDAAGRQGFVLTLATREQHIRRERATSNICSNEGLCALAATIFLSALGKRGLAEAALQNRSKARWLRERILALPGWRPLFDGPFFNEFAVAGPEPPARVRRRLARAGILGGLDLGRWYRGLRGGLLFCVTENNTRAEMERLLAALEGRR